jgi:methionyl-tRNA synthetase
MMKKNKVYIATSIPYLNAEPHMGHTLDVLYGDVLSRYYRLLGHDVLLQAGMDENGQKIYQKALDNKLSPEEWILKLRPVFKDFFEKLNIEYDVLTNTSEQKHHRAAQELWKRAFEKGDIYKKKYKGLYCVGCESFKNEEDIVNGKCPDHQTSPEHIEEENYFFALSKYEEFLKKLLSDNPEFVFPKSSYNEALKMLEGGLEDVSISRPKARLPWGVPVPGDSDHVMYVWFDALTNYLTALGFPDGTESFKDFWPPDVEIVGKDNNRWHTLLWPAMLKSADLKIPSVILVHSYILGKGGIKMSKTIGNVIDPVGLLEKYGSDPLRYYLLTRIPIDNDGIIDLDLFESVYNSELSNDLGNLLQRSIAMINKYHQKPEKISATEIYLDEAVSGYRFDLALKLIWEQIKELNVLIDREKPWELAKTSPQKLAAVLNGIYEELWGIAEALTIFMPETAEKMKKQLKSLVPEPLFPRIES